MHIPSAAVVGAKRREVVGPEVAVLAASKHSSYFGGNRHCIGPISARKLLFEDIDLYR